MDADVPFALPVQEPCHFCEIIHGRADRWSVIEQTDATITMLNDRQFEVGQCIVVPIRHAPTLLHLNEVEDAAVMAAARRAARAMIEAFSPEGILLYQNNGVGSGQEVPHFHLHVVPRQPGSDWGLGPPHIARLEQLLTPKIDHAAITDAKRETARLLQRWISSAR